MYVNLKKVEMKKNIIDCNIRVLVLEWIWWREFEIYMINVCNIGELIGSFRVVY